MAEENKEDKEKSSQDAAPEEKPKESPEDSDKEEGDEKHIDFKAELEREKRRRQQAEYVIEQEKRRRKELERERPELDEESIRNIIQEEMRREMSSLKRDLDRSRVEQMIESIASSEDEANLIKYHYENTINPTGNIKEDVENARVLANKKRFEHQISEIKRAEESKKNLGSGIGAGQKPSEKAQEPKLTEFERKTLKRLNAKWDPEKEAFVLPSGRIWKPDQTL